MSKVRLSLSTYVYVCLCMCIYMSIYLYTLEDKMENCIEQMSKETTNINYDPPDNSQSSITAATNLSYSWYVSNGFGNSRKYIF